MQQIRTATGEVIKTGANLFLFFNDRCKAKHGNARWGDHYRAMKRRKDPECVVAKCKETGEVLVHLEREAK